MTLTKSVKPILGLTVFLSLACAATQQIPPDLRARYYAQMTWSSLDKSFTAWTGNEADAVVRLGGTDEGKARAQRLASAVEAWNGVSAMIIAAFAVWTEGAPEPSDMRRLLTEAYQIASAHGVIQ